MKRASSFMSFLRAAARRLAPSLQARLAGWAPQPAPVPVPIPIRPDPLARRGVGQRRRPGA